MFENLDTVHKALVTIFIERTLLDLGKPIYDKVVRELERTNHCHLPDCYDHPEYLRNVLYGLYGDSGHEIVKSIIREMDEFKESKKIAHFIDILSQQIPKLNRTDENKYRK